MKWGDAIEVFHPKRSELNCMERWNELVAGLVLGNLTPEEAESIAKILAANPQLASDIARLRNTATVRSLRITEWSTARSQDGLEGWADTALDLSVSSIVLEEISARVAVTGEMMLGDDRAEAVRTKKLPPILQFERFLMIEALLVPLFNPLWWTVLVIAVALGIDDFLVRRSLSNTLEVMPQLEAVPQFQILESPSQLNDIDGGLLGDR